MILTFCDAGVLIAAARAVGRDGERAVQFLEDPNRSFLTSPFVHLEVVPKAIFYKKPLLSKTGRNLATRVANGGLACPELEFLRWRSAASG